MGLLAFLFCGIAYAEPLAGPGDMRLRHDLQLLNDRGIMNIPLTAWPVSFGDVHNALARQDDSEFDESTNDALRRIRSRLARELNVGSFDFEFGVAGTNEPTVIRNFEHTLRGEIEANAGLAWVGERFALHLAATYVDEPFDGDELRPDGTYIGAVLGNWIVTAGWQDRWLGPGRDSSLILSNNARPAPGIMLQRINSTPLKTKWLSWLGPWTLTTFMAELDDERVVNDALLFGIRGSFRPVQGLEIGISRTAQWCGDGRPCDLSTFADLLVGNDNRGVNVSSDDEPGNQLGGFDIRYVLPRQIPVAAYMQWIGEDGRGGGGAIGSWLRQVGVESWGLAGTSSYRVHLEVSDSTCKEGGFGFSGDKPGCAYEHGIYQTGYRYKNRSLGLSADGDSLSYSIGSTLVQSAGHTWNATVRHMKINREGTPNPRHTLTPTPTERFDIGLTHVRATKFGKLHVGTMYRDTDAVGAGQTSSEISGFIRWSSR